MQFDLYVDEEGHVHLYQPDSKPSKPMEKIGTAFLQVSIESGWPQRASTEPSEPVQ